MAGQYQFVATCKNILQEDVSFNSNILYIGYADPTPVPTEAPIVTPPQPVHEDIPTDDGLPSYVSSVQSLLHVLWIVCLILAIISGLLLAIGLVRRAQQKAQSDKAYDHLERGNYRDYNAPAPKEKSHKGGHSESPMATISEEADLTAPEAETAEQVAEEEIEDETGLPAEYDAEQVEEAGGMEQDGGVLEETMQALYPRTSGRRISQRHPWKTARKAPTTLLKRPRRRRLPTPRRLRGVAVPADTTMTKLLHRLCPATPSAHRGAFSTETHTFIYYT